MRNGFVMFLFALLAGSSACRRGTETAPSVLPPISVKVRQVQKIDRPALVSVSGSVDARETIKTSFLVAGRIARINVREGQAVKQGQILAELDATDYRHGLDAALAQAAAAQAKLDKANAGARAQEVEQARISFERAEDEYNRLKLLYERRSLAPNDFKKAEALYEASRQQYNLAKEGARKEDKDAAKAMVEQAQAGMQVARKRVTDTVLRAPITGWIARKLFEPGEMIAAGMPVLVLMDLNPAEINVGVPESDIAVVRSGLKATVSIAALPGQQFDGRVDLVGVAAEPQSRTFPTKILVPNPQGILKAGMIAEASIQAARRVSAITVPTQAIVRDPQGATLIYVYFPDQKRVFSRRVEAGTVYGQEVEVTSGLKGDEMIVVGGQQLVREGAVVTTEGTAQ